ncbi:MAG TPA: porin [Candidatus Kapabacteria bacterium]|jgi:hypothetical protein|nr:porin [Candidatus Kapabacteria bacterium]HOM04912.1 porin [Candidatus Kapabacteria bacterium]
MRKFKIIILFLVISSQLLANSPQFSILGYVDAYYCTDNLDKEFDLFSSINHRRETFALNIAYLKFGYYDENLRATLALQEGDIPKNIYFQEPKNIQQANIEYRLFDRFWLGAGIFSTHLGGETTHPRNNYLSSHSSTTFFEPTYQTGVMLQYELTNNFSIAAYLINGNHLFEDNNKNKTIAFAFNYALDNFSISYNNMFGNEEPEGRKSRLHTYHNVIVNTKLSKSLELLGQIDFATLENSYNGGNGTMKSGFLSYRYSFNEKFSNSARVSYYSETENVYNLDVEGFDFTIGVEYKPTSNSYIRFESRYLKNNSGGNKFAFQRNGKPTNELTEFSINFGGWFDFFLNL